MKHSSNSLSIIVLTFALGAASLNAIAATSNQDSASVFNVQKNSTFSGNIDTGTTNFNNSFYSTVNGDLPLAAGSTDRNWLGLANQRGNTYQGRNQQFNFGRQNFGRQEGMRFTAGVPVSPVPEPEKFALLAIGLILFTYFANRRRAALIRSLD